MRTQLTFVLAFVLFAFDAGAAFNDTLQHIVNGRYNSPVQQAKPYVILISADGFRHDYAEKYQAKFLLARRLAGVSAASMIPSFPSVTFPNHYSIVTGMYPSHHGLVNNTFYDPTKKETYSMGDRAKVGDGSWYGGTPLWVLAEQQQMVSASMFWVGSEAAIKNIRPTYYYDFNDRMEVDKRLEAVKDWLSLPDEKRPHLITFYLSDVDHAGHSYGPDAPETERSVQRVDSIVMALTNVVGKTGLPVNFIFLADHGMTNVNREEPLPVPEVIDRNKFLIPTSGTMMVLHAKDTADILPVYNELKMQERYYKVYLKTNMPEELHYRNTDDTLNRIGDIMLVPEWPYVFSNRKPGVGYHGFVPSVKDMHAAFIAWGPAFKKNQHIPSFENVNVYPLVAKMLGLAYGEKIDGDIRVLQNTLR